jgi:hypothetical protein
LFLHGAERAAHRQGGQLCGAGVLRSIEVTGENDAEAVPERQLLVRHALALREDLVPLRRQFHAFGSL